MKEEILYSVIIPVYNAEKVLDKSIQSVLEQTERNFQLLLIDDGSTDRSLAICKEYAKKDDRVIVIHKENGGVSSARNAGLKRAKGKYIVFIDSDDLVEPDLLYVMKESDADLVMVGCDDYDQDGKVTAYYWEEEEYEINDDKSINHFLDNRLAVFVWGKRYKKEILQDKICFNESHRFSEDILFNIEYIKNVNSVDVIGKVEYHHCHYQFETLSSVTGKYSLIQRTAWQEAAYYQFEGHPNVQERFGKLYLFYSEKEFEIIANLPCSVREKIRKIHDLITHPYYQLVVKKYPKQLPKDIRICSYFMWAFPIMMKYKKHR